MDMDLDIHDNNGSHHEPRIKRPNRHATGNRHVKNMYGPVFTQKEVIVNMCEHRVSM